MESMLKELEINLYINKPMQETRPFRVINMIVLLSLLSVMTPSLKISRNYLVH
jgi:hypothetical protein